MRIFIVGATGVLGRALIPLLRQQGHTVRALVRTPERAYRLATSDLGVETVLGDLLTQETVDQLPAMLADCEGAAHIATAIPQDREAPGAWEETTLLRTEGTQALLQASLAAGVTRYVQQSIVMAYPDGGDEWLDETTPLDSSPERANICEPVFIMEDMVWGVSPEQLQWCILRGGSFVGPGTYQDTQIERLLAGHLTVPCDGSNFLSLVHVADMAAAVALALEHAPAGSTFNIVDEPIRNGEYLDLLAGLVDAPVPLRDPLTPCPPSFRCTNKAARTVLHWKPIHSIWPVNKRHTP